MSERVHSIAVMLALGGVFGWLIVHTIRRAEDPPQMIFKWVLTLICMSLTYWQAFPMAEKSGIAAFSGVCLAMFYGLVMAVTWRRTIGGLIARPFASLYDGGNVPPEPRPAYSIAQTRAKQGKYVESILEIRKQLERFPTDFEGQLMMAQVQAENLKDLTAAEATIQQLCAQPGHAPRNIAFALYSMADWHLKYATDAEAARRCLEQVGVLLPGTEFALSAAQRVAHLGDPEMLLAPHDRRIFSVAPGIRNVGLAREPMDVAPIAKEPGEQAAEYVKHLEAHPLDMEVREKLAVLYADHYQRLDLALDQLEQMINEPSQPHRLAVRWLNLMADLQLRFGADYDTIRATLERIVELDPNLAAAEIARKRIDLLKLELKGQRSKEAIKMGTYEQNIGLKSRRRAE
jgi:hypothetical protein